MFYRVLSLSLTLIIASALSAHAYLVTFTLEPANGAISGAPGATIGWGLTIKNEDSTNWIWINAESVFTVLHGPTLGTYADFSLNSNPVAPSTTAYLPFDLLNSTGAGSFAIFGTAPYDETSSGYIQFTYDIYDGDPFASGNQIGSDYANVNASVTTPEPSTYVLLTIALGAVGYVRRKMRIEN